MLCGTDRSALGALSRDRRSVVQSASFNDSRLLVLSHARLRGQRLCAELATRREATHGLGMPRPIAAQRAAFPGHRGAARPCRRELPPPPTERPAVREIMCIYPQSRWCYFERDSSARNRRRPHPGATHDDPVRVVSPEAGPRQRVGHDLHEVVEVQGARRRWRDQPRCVDAASKTPGGPVGAPQRPGGRSGPPSARSGRERCASRCGCRCDPGTAVRSGSHSCLAPRAD